MADIVVAEKNNSRSFSLTEGKVSYLVFGYDEVTGLLTDFDPADALDAVIAQAPSTWVDLGFLRRTPTVKDLTIGVYEAEVPYTSPNLSTQVDTPPDGSVTYSFDIGTESVNIKQSLGTTSYGPKKGSGHGNLINVTDGKAEGVDILMPTATFTLTYKATGAIFTPTYQLTVEGLVGKVNSDTFKGRAAGTLLFTGCRGTVSYDESIASDISFTFAYRENQTGLTVGNITSIAKGGWEYLWVEYEKTDDATAKNVKAKPVAVYVEQVYPTAAFSALGL